MTYFTLQNIYVDHSSYPLIGSRQPVFSWSAAHTGTDEKQTACRVSVFRNGEEIWDSGWQQTAQPQMKYAGPALESLCSYEAEVTLKDSEGRESEPGSLEFMTPLYEKWPAGWIAHPEDRERHSPCFRREFRAEGVERAVLCCCGIGYQSVTLNGGIVDTDVLSPATSDYTRTCYYTVQDITDWLEEGVNCIGVELGEGWRRNFGDFLGNNLTPGAARFYGRPQLTAFIRLYGENGGYRDILTDSEWTCGYGGYVDNNLFDGVTFDARLEPVGFNMPGFNGDGFVPAVSVPAPGEEGCFIMPRFEPDREKYASVRPHTPEMRPQTIPPMEILETIAPVHLYPLKENTWIVDFGREIAGTVSLYLPCAEAGETVSVQYAEELSEDGGLYLDNLRGAACTDTYIASGEEDGRIWTPKFVYHGFRYVSVTGYPGILTADSLMANVIRTGLEKKSSFACGSALVNAIHQLCVHTEEDNIHSIATDCPQRDERMGWMNDATVRFEETPYNFDIGRLFPKIVRDFTDEQDENGAITCTAPFIYGNCPADPVCSSFLILGQQAWLTDGDTDLLEQTYDRYAAWAENLHSSGVKAGEEWLVPYSYYGDWAGPADACMSMEDPHSSSVEGALMSSGYLYYNYCLLEKFARALSRPEDAAEFAHRAGLVKDAILKKWYHKETATLDRGGQSAQAFGLWLKLIPEEDRVRAAEEMKEAVVKAGNRITTGNLCTRYLLDMLAEYGYADLAWKLIQREEYPSWGYMIQNAATTVWERFELKKNGGMNSHCHPMYGAMDRWFYSHLMGVRPLEPGWTAFTVDPLYPEGLLYSEATVETPRGGIYVRWHKKYGKTYLSVNVPFNTVAEVTLPGGKVEQGSGFKIYEF